MTVPVDLHNALTDMNQQLDRIKDEMEAGGVPPASILAMDIIVRNSFAMMITAQHEKTPIDEMDEALVSAFATVLFDYMQRVHPKNTRGIVVEHMKLIFDDMKQRVAENVVKHFTPGDPPEAKLKVVKH